MKTKDQGFGEGYRGMNQFKIPYGKLKLQNSK